MGRIGGIQAYGCSILLPEIMTDMESAADISAQMKKVHDDMEKVWKQNVFYDTGQITIEELAVAWMDFRSFCMDGSIYNLLFNSGAIE